VKILRADEASASPLFEDWRETPWASLFWGLALFALAAAIAGFPVWAGEVEPLLLLFCLAGAWLFGFFALANFRCLRASRGPDGWLIRWSSAGLYLRYRSLFNHRFPADTPSVLFLLPREIAGIRPFRHRFDAAHRDADRSIHRRSKGQELALVLGEGELDVLRRALATEHLRHGPRGGRFEHRPVTLTPDGRLRVLLRRPRAALEALSRCYRVDGREAASGVTVDLETAHRQEEAIISLVEAGETLAAIRAVRQRYGCDLAEARRLVREMAGA
jgi:hypothetical protein